jgi:hypothetical protein
MELFRLVSIFCIFRLCPPAPSICNQDFEGFWPSMAFVMAKKLMNGSVVEFYPSVGFTQCNKRTFTFKLDSPLKSAWHLLGGGANVGLLTYRVVGSWLNPMLTSETVVGHDLTLTGNCAPTTVSTMTGANQDCVVGSWSRETGCSQACGPGMRTRTRYVVNDAKGTGLKCPAATCGPGCISQNVTCNGATDNPLLCNAACVAGANDCKCRPTGARCDGHCSASTTRRAARRAHRRLVARAVSAGPIFLRRARLAWCVATVSARRWIAAVPVAYAKPTCRAISVSSAAASKSASLLR